MTHVDSFVLLLGIYATGESEVGMWSQKGNGYQNVWGYTTKTDVTQADIGVYDTSHHYIRSLSPGESGAKFLCLTSMIKLWRRYF